MATRSTSPFLPRPAFPASQPATIEPSGETATVDRDQAGRFRESMLPHMDSAYNFACYLSRDPLAAEDIVQDAFLRAFRAFHTWRGEAARPWLLAIVRNCFLTWARTNRAGHACAERPDDPADGVRRSVMDLDNIDHADPEAMLLRRDEVETVRAALQSLPEPFRETLVLRELEGLSYNEIAAQAAVPVGTVMSRLARGRRMLSERLHLIATPDGETLS